MDNDFNKNYNENAKIHIKMQIKPLVKQHIKAAVFLLLIVVLVALADFIKTKSGYSRAVIHAADNSDRDTGYDCIILGASHGRNSVNPYKLDETGFTEDAFNLSIPGEYIEDSYYLLKEACSNNEVKTVILDMDYQYWSYVTEDRNYVIYSSLPLSEVKIEFIGNELMEEDFRKLFLRNWAYVAKYSDIPGNLKMKLTREYFNYDMSAVIDTDATGPYVGKGFYYNAVVKTDKGAMVPNPWSDENISDVTLDYFNRIVNYCKNNDIQLICITSPISVPLATTGMQRYASAYFSELCSNSGVEYIDFNLVSLDVLDRPDDEYMDWEGHMSGVLADKFSIVLGNELKARDAGKSCYYFYNDYDEFLADYEARQNN